jgi:hypothetical protein
LLQLFDNEATFAASTSKLPSKISYSITMSHALFNPASATTCFYHFSRLDQPLDLAISASSAMISPALLLLPSIALNMQMRSAAFSFVATRLQMLTPCSPF